MDMKKYNIKKLDTSNVGKVKRVTYQFTRKDNKPNIDIDVLDDIINGLEKQAEKKGENIKIMVRALNCQRWFTLKGFDETLNVQDFDDYYKGKVQKTEKFEKFSQLQVTILK